VTNEYYLYDQVSILRTALKDLLSEEYKPSKAMMILIAKEALAEYEKLEKERMEEWSKNNS
jgi:hypothetical protein